jgi:galactokinase
LRVAAVLREIGYPLRGANLLIDGQVPIGSALSSSAAIEVATALVLTSLGEVRIPVREVARLCQRAENTYTGARCGIMDQFVCCIGRQDHVLLLDCRSLESTYLKLPSNVVLVICNTMVRHEIASGEYNLRRASCERSVDAVRQCLPNIRALRDLTLEDLEKHRRVLSDVGFRRCRHVITENQRVQDAEDALQHSDLQRFGQLMYASHASLDEDCEVSCRELNVMVDLARKVDGVYGSRMTGGGFGGCTVNLIESKAVAEFQTIISRDYEKLTRLSPKSFVSHLAGGASELPL